MLYWLFNKIFGNVLIIGIWIWKILAWLNNTVDSFTFVIYVLILTLYKLFSNLINKDLNADFQHSLKIKEERYNRNENVLNMPDIIVIDSEDELLDKQKEAKLVVIGGRMRYVN
jgi:c-di-AMP phosphodiesterase-like protein